MGIRFLIFSNIFLFFVLLGCSPQEEEQQQFVIGFSQCTGGDAWRQAMHEEMQREVSFYPDLALEIKDAENSSIKQVEHIRQFIAQNVDLLIVSPNESVPITPVVEEAFEKGIPVIVVDRRTGSSLYSAYVGANNYEVGKLAGELVAKLLNGQGKIVEVWGLKGSSPALDRHTGFMEAISAYEGLEVVGEVKGEWEKEIAKSRFPESPYALQEDVDLIFAHNDVMALGVFESLKEIRNTDDLKFVGIDGLGGPKGGIQFIEDGILDGTVLYPTGGEEIIRLASKILHNEPYDKENILNSTVIDERNVHIMKQQVNKILSQHKSIERQQERIAEQIRIYRTQRTLLYIVLGSLIGIVILGGLALLALREKQEMNKVLIRKNREVISQRNEIAKMAKKAEKATQAKFKFFTNISHEFRTPLTLILGPVEDALRSDIPQELKKDLFLVKKNAHRLLKLVNQLMDFRKVENQKMKVRASENDIILFVQNIASSFERLAAKRKIDFKVKTKLKELKVYFDADKLDKILFNLLSNAFKFTKEGGIISIELELSESFDKVIILIEDNGKGMTPEQVEHAFDRFYSGETDNNLSTGLGLALSKEFVKLHKGEISVVSEKWNGTRFVLALPLGRDHLKEDEIVVESGESLVSSVPVTEDTDLEVDSESLELEQERKKIKEHTVLLIEDNEELRDFLRKRLRKEYNVVEAPDGLSGVNQAFEMVPDVVICDIMLPNKSGLDVTTILKNDLRTSHIPVVLLTARDALEQKIEGVQAGADFYVTKPFSYQYLNERVKGLIKLRGMLREHYSSEIQVDSKAILSPKQLDKKFINEFTAKVEENISNPELNANELASKLGLSRVQLYRKVKALVGYSVNDYVVNVRLKKARHLMLHSEMNISEIAYEVGFASPAYFSTTFKSHFKVTPSEFKFAHQSTGYSAVSNDVV